MTKRLTPLSAGLSGGAGVLAAVAVIATACGIFVFMWSLLPPKVAVTPKFPQLEAQYMECVRMDEAMLSARQTMDNDTLFHCSAVSAQLQVLKFGGDFQKLQDWANHHGR